MKFFPRLFPVLLAVICLALFTCVNALAGGDEWRPVDKADLQSTTPVVDKDADAEVIFWEGRVVDELQEGLDTLYPRTVINHYLRIKIFTERGREAQSKVDIPYDNDVEIKDL